MATKVALSNVHFSLPGFAPGQLEHHLVHRGEPWDFTGDEWKRLSPAQQDSFGTDAELAAQVEAESTGDVRATDAALAAMNVEQVHTYLNQLPEALYDAEAVRVLEAERARAKPRRSVLDLVDPELAE
jgi:hypothetical protein